MDKRTDDLRRQLVKIEAIDTADFDALSDEIDGIDQALSKLEDERDSARALADAAPTEDDIEDDIRDKIARDLEPIFGALFAGDLDRARGGVNALAGYLRADDPIIVAIQRAKARPNLFHAVAG